MAKAWTVEPSRNSVGIVFINFEYFNVVGLIKLG